MSEATSPFTHDQLPSMLSPIKASMVPMEEYSIPFDAESIVDPALVGLPPASDGTRYSVLQQFDLAGSKAEEPDGIGLFAIRVDYPKGAREVFLMSAAKDESGNVIPAGDWRPIAGSGGEVTVGRGPTTSTNEYGENREKIQIAEFTASDPTAPSKAATVSREHLGIRYDYNRQRLQVRDLGSLSGTTTVSYPESQTMSAEVDEDTHEREATAQAIGDSATKQAVVVELVDGIPEVSSADISGRIAELSQQITEDPALEAVERVRAGIRQARVDKDEIYKDSQKPVSKQEFHNHSNMLEPLKRREYLYYKDLTALEKNGSVERFDLHPLVAERARLQSELAAQK